MNVIQIKDVIRDIDSRDINDLMLAKASLHQLDGEWQSLGVETEEWILDGISSLSREINRQNHDKLQKQLRTAKIRRDELKTASEKRKDLDDLISSLEKKIGG